jgi:twitching motility protein PilT
MGAVDGLLALVGMQKASGLVLATGEVPALVFASASRPLSMPALTPALFDAFLADVLDGREHARLADAGSVAATYRSARTGERFDVVAERDGDRAVLRFALAGAGGSAPVPGASLAALVVAAVDRGASDVILAEGRTPRVRIAGHLESDGPVTSADEVRDLVGAHLTPDGEARLRATGSVDFACTIGAGDGARRFRANLFRHHVGLSLTLRPIAERIPTLDALGLPRALAGLATLTDGIVLLNGPAGSGKSTTLAALVGEINRTRAAHVITLEDPIEYLHAPDRSLIHQREVGTHVESFGAGLRAALRESPDVILVGEMRDLETIALALTAAETGHLVLSTLHSANGAMAVDRIIDVFPDAQQAQVRAQLAGVLRAVVTQRLLPSREPGVRVPAVELLRGTYGVAAMIRDGKTHQLATQIHLGRDEGTIPIERSLVELVRAGRITRETAIAAARSPEDFERWLKE